MENENLHDKVLPSQNETAASAAPAEPTPQQALNANGKKRWFGRGVYGSKDVPIRVLDICICIMIVAAIVLTIINANLGGFNITFNTGMSDVTVPAQKVMHGNVITKPEAPIRPGYTLAGWAAADDSTEPWTFGTPVESDMTLYALWVPAEVTVKFDLDGGEVNGSTTVPDGSVTYSESYGTLPAPTKQGSTFAGWQYDGKAITAESRVEATGEHVLTALWQ